MSTVQEKRKLYFNSGQLQQILDNIHTMSGVWVNVLDGEGDVLRGCGGHSAFCRAVRSVPEGEAHCRVCCNQAVHRYATSASSGLCSGRCHAGLREYLLPIYEEGAPIAYFVFGQVLDTSPKMQQWEKTAMQLGWYTGDLEALGYEFLSLRQCSEQEIMAVAEMLELLADYIQLRGVICSAEYTDLQKLELYIDKHYTEKLSLRSISDELHIGTTKLCAMAKKLPGGMTMRQLISQRRVAEAKKLLASQNCPISSVASMVGFSDYNYFTRIFKSCTGVTPREYRKNFEETNK